jgi:hypothetical protein
MLLLRLPVKRGLDMSTMTLHLGDLPKNRVTAIKRRAREMGVTPSSYVKKLIDDDIEYDAVVRNSTFAELSAPLSEALAGVSEEELDRRVDAARTRHYQRTSKRKR